MDKRDRTIEDLLSNSDKIWQHVFIYHVSLLLEATFPDDTFVNKDTLKAVKDAFSYRCPVWGDGKSSIKVSVLGLPQFFEAEYRPLMSIINAPHRILSENLHLLLSTGKSVRDIRLWIDALTECHSAVIQLTERLDQESAWMQKYLLFQLSLTRKLTNLIQCFLGVSHHYSKVSWQRLKELSTPCLLNYLTSYVVAEKSLTPLMYKFIDYLLGVSSDRVMGFEDFANNYVYGTVGEALFAEAINGKIVGQLGGKADVSTDSRDFSIKTSTSAEWRHHLSYIRFEDYPDFQSLADSQYAVRTLRYTDDQWADLISKLISGNGAVTYLVFQRLYLEENVLMQKSTWLCNLATLIDKVRHGHYIIKGSSISIIADNKEVVFTLHFQSRNQGKKIQVLLSTEESLLDNATEVSSNLVWKLHNLT